MENKGLRFLLSLVIALGIWLFVVSVVSPESEVEIRDIPVILDGEGALADRNLIVVSDKNFTVDLKLFGSRVDLNKLSASNITIVADLSQITEPGEHNVRYDILYPSSVQSGNVDAKERNPQYLKLMVAERGWKEVPVKIKYTGSVPDNYVVDRQNPKFDNAFITVSGPIEALEKVDHASISVDLEGKTETIVANFRPVLCAADGTPLTELGKLTMDVTEVRATIKIFKIKQVPLVVEVKDGGGLTSADVKLTQTLDTIVVSGSDAELEKLDKIVVGRIDLSELVESTEVVFDITMDPGVNNITGVTKVKVNVELLVQLETRSFKVNQIRLENVPGNRGVKLLTKELTVKIRRTKEALDQLKPEDIVAVVEWNNDENGVNVTIWLYASIRLPEGSSAGAVGMYPVLVEVSPMGTGG
jgi:hypothetical protein